MNGSVRGKSKEGFWIAKQRHSMTMEHQRGGDLYFKSGKDACMSSNLKALHIYFYSLQENPQRSPTRLKKKNH
jgi:hypothetical protein